ncbi:hypothetical protein O6H91_06G011600 [Diphasiastrum complanatum]|nr:hypothetical protein O6H91_06G011600 [Diphasiastrum complanatum]
MESKQYLLHSSKDKEIAIDLDHAAGQDAFTLAPGDATDRSKDGYDGAVTVARYKPAWSEHFQFLAAVKVKEQVSCLHILSRDGDDGSIRYVAVGDATGRVYLFNSFGDLLLDFRTHSPASVTVMQSISLRKNETLFVTGHSNGDVLAHKIRETGYHGSSSGDGWHKLFMEFLHPFLHTSPTSAVSGAPSSASRTAFPDPLAEASHEELQKTTPITNLEIYRVGRMRYLLVSDKAGRISVFRDNGTLYGVAESPSRPLAFLRSMSTQKMLFLTESGAASLDLRTMAVRSSPCSGLDGSTVILYAFDAVVRSKAYGVTAAGELIHVVLSGDTLHFECHTRGPKRKLEIEPPLALHGFKGYLLAATMHEIIVCNTTMQFGFGPASIRVAAPRPIFRAPVEDIVTISVNMQISKSEFPVLAGDRERLVVLGFGDGYVGIFRSTLPVFKPLDFSAKLWSSPIIISVVVLMGVWFFFGRKRDLGLASFPDAPIYGAIDSSVSGISKYENVRAGYGEIRDRLEDSREYGSPTRTFTASRSSYGTGSLNFRASSVEPVPYSTRRDAAFSSNELVGD